PAVAEAGAGRLQAPEAHLQSLSAWRHEDRPQTATLVDHVPSRQVPRRQEGHPGQSREEDRWGGWAQEPHASPAPPARARPDRGPQGAAGPPGLDSQTRQGRTAPPWY